MPKKKFDYIIIEDGQPVPQRRLRFILIGMLLGTLTLAGAMLAVTSVSQHLDPFPITPSLPPAVTAISTLTEETTNVSIRELKGVTVSPDGTILAVGMLGKNGWSVEMRRLNSSQIADSETIIEFPVVAPPLRLTFSPDGQWLAVGGGAPLGWSIVEIHDGRTGTPRFSIPGGYASFSPDGKWLVTTADRNSAIFLWDVASGALLKTLYHPGGVAYEARFTPDGKSLVATTYSAHSRDSYGRPVSDNQGLSQWDLANLDAAPITKNLMSGDLIPQFDISPDGRFTMIIMRGGVQVIDQRQDSLLRWGIMDGIPRSIAFSPDGEWLALGFSGLYPSPTYGNVSSPISLYSVTDAREIRLLTGARSNNDIAFMPNDPYILATGESNTLIQWNYLDGTQTSQLRF